MNNSMHSGLELLMSLSSVAGPRVENLINKSFSKARAG